MSGISIDALGSEFLSPDDATSNVLHNYYSDISIDNIPTYVNHPDSDKIIGTEFMERNKRMLNIKRENSNTFNTPLLPEL